MSDGEGQAQGRPWQEGQAQEGSLDLCQVCQAPRGAHEGRRHMFTPPGVRVDTSQFARKRPMTSPSSDQGGTHVQHVQATPQALPDMVLRQALLAAGIITLTDLDNAQKQIEALGVAVRRASGAE